MHIRLQIMLSLSLLSLNLKAAPLIGKVTDRDSGTPLEFVNVVALDADSLYLGGCATDSLGRFEIEAPGAASLSFMLIGYQPLQSAVANGAEIMEISLQPTENLLGEVSVTSVRPETRMQGTSFITTVSNTFLASMVSVPDMMKWIPGLTISNRQIKVFQKSNPAIYINNRKITSFSEIESLDPSIISNVEIIPQSGVKYGSDVDCVIIIHTKRNLPDSISLSLMTYNTYANYYSNQDHLNFTYRKKGFEITLGAHIFPEHFKQGSDITMEAHGENPWVKETSQRTDHRHNGGNGGNGSLAVSYDFNPNQSIGARYMCEGFKINEKTWSSIAVDMASGYRETVSSANTTHSRLFPKHLTNLYYIGTFGNLKLDFNLDFNKLTNKADENFIEESSINPSANITTATENRSTLVAEKLTATWQLNRLQIIFGEEITRTDVKSQFTGRNSTITDNCSYSKENSFAAFAEINKTFGKITAVAGIRYELNRDRFTHATTGDTPFSHTEGNWFPSASVNGSFGNVNLSLGYDYRLQRPAFGQLNNPVSYVDPFTVRQGNPYLKSSKLHSLTLNASWKQLWGRIFLTSQSNGILAVLTPDTGHDRLTIVDSYANFDTRTRLGATVGGNFTWGIWYCSGNLFFVHQWFKIPYCGTVINMGSDILSLTLNNRLTLPWGMAFYLYYSMDNSYIVANTDFAARFDLSASLSKSFLNNTLQVEIGANDILNKNTPSRTIYYPLLHSHIIDRGDRRNFTFSVRYSFNTHRDSRYKGSGAGADAKSRL